MRPSGQKKHLPADVADTKSPLHIAPLFGPEDGLLNCERWSSMGRMFWRYVNSRDYGCSSLRRDFSDGDKPAVSATVPSATIVGLTSAGSEARWPPANAIYAHRTRERAA
jgi:hypothetical protein